MAKKNETGSASAIETASSNKAWRYSIISLAVVAVLAIGGTVYYGAVALPAEQKVASIAACKKFDKAYSNAKFAFITEMIQKDHEPKPLTAIDNYMDKLFSGSIQAAKNLPYETDLGKALIDLNVSKLSFDGSSNEAANQSFHNYDNQAMAIQSLCYGLGVGSDPSATPSN